MEGGLRQTRGSSSRTQVGPLSTGQRGLITGQADFSAAFPRGDQLAEGGGGELCEPLESETQKEVSGRNLKQEELRASGPKEAVGWLAWEPGLGAPARAFDGASAGLSSAVLGSLSPSRRARAGFHAKCGLSSHPAQSETRP